PGVSGLIEAAHPGWSSGAMICRDDLSTFRSAYVETLLERERGELGDLERQVIDSLTSGALVSQNLIDDPENSGTFGERAADRVAQFGGSWHFIILFVVILMLWMGANIVGLLAQP